MTVPKIQLKGIRDGILVTFGEGAWQELREALMEQIDSQGEFLRGARLALDVGSHILRAAELGHLRDTLSERGLTLWAVLSSSPTTEATAQTLGLATRIAKPKPVDRAFTSAETQQSGEQGVLVKRTLRSGVKVQHSGHVVVIGDVNPGAEVVAGGDVVVWGRLRGSVQAGAEGDAGAVVCALELAPTQLRIAGTVMVVTQRRGKPQPNLACLQDGQIVLQQWNPKGK